MHGATIVVWRRGTTGREYLVLRRVEHHANGDWEWTPPSGMSEADEPAADTAARELLEETGLTLPLTAVQDAEWALFAAEAAPTAAVRLSAEHDRFEWLPLEDACARCLPAVVAEGLRAAG